MQKEFFLFKIGETSFKYLRVYTFSLKVFSQEENVLLKKYLYKLLRLLT